MSPSLKRAFLFSLLASLLATAAILLLRPFVAGIALAPDQGFNWYYWKRPDPNTLSRAAMWAGYVLHQLFLWGVLAWAQANRDRLRERTKLHPINIIALLGTAGFVGLHALQTALFYDGLGQDLPVITSQGSVVLLLVVVLMLEAPRRGLFFGRARLFSGMRPLLIRYHGYYFAWAVVFTFWYHPMETNLGHLSGFLYMFLLFVQAAFIFTRVHTNRWWTFVLEGAVLLHGVIVALVAGQEFWPMFAFGFLFLAVVTQMHGLPLPRAAKWGIALVSLAAMLFVYADRGWGALNEVLRIPVIDYALVFVLAGAVVLIQKLAKNRRA